MPGYPLILLCGGKSERMGFPKGLLEVERSPLFLYHIRKFYSSGGSHVILVLGYHHNKYGEFITWTGNVFNDDWNDYDGINVAITVNHNPEKGQFSSLQTGLERFSKEAFKAAFIMPVDMLPPEKKAWEVLESGMSGNVKACIPVYENKGGHPVLISSLFAADLLSIPLTSPDARLDHQLRSIPSEKVKYLEVNDEKITGNINLPSDF